MDPAWIALIATVCGGVGLKTIEYWLGKGHEISEDAQHIRNELRTDLNNKKSEVKDVEADRDKWREAYFSLREQMIAVQTQIRLLTSKKPPE